MIKTRLTIMLLVGLIWVGLVWGRDDGGQTYKAPADIVATLPKICWWFYMDNVPNTPEYNIKITCGVYSNHYCPGLVAMKVADKAKTKQQRVGALMSAKNEMEYTLGHVSNNIHPDCTVLPSARMNLDFVILQLELLKGKPQNR